MVSSMTDLPPKNSKDSLRISSASTSLEDGDMLKMFEGLVSNTFCCRWFQNGYHRRRSSMSFEWVSFGRVRFGLCDIQQQALTDSNQLIPMFFQSSTRLPPIVATAAYCNSLLRLASSAAVISRTHLFPGQCTTITTVHFLCMQTSTRLWSLSQAAWLGIAWNHRQSALAECLHPFEIVPNLCPTSRLFCE